jgi:hypothetical protein
VFLIGRMLLFLSERVKSDHSSELVTKFGKRPPASILDNKHTFNFQNCTKYLSWPFQSGFLDGFADIAVGPLSDGFSLSLI